MEFFNNFASSHSSMWGGGFKCSCFRVPVSALHLSLVYYKAQFKPAITGVIAHDNQKTTYYKCTTRGVWSTTNQYTLAMVVHPRHPWGWLVLAACLWQVEVQQYGGTLPHGVVRKSPLLSPPQGWASVLVTRPHAKHISRTAFPSMESSESLRG